MSALPKGWTPELVEVLKQAAVEAGFGIGKLALAEVRKGQFAITERTDGPNPFAAIPRRIIVGIDRDGAAPTVTYWRETNGPLSAAQTAYLSGYEFPRTERLADDTMGYYVRAPRTDDCMAAAIATALRVPIDDVPDPRIDERLCAGDPPADIDRDAQRELAWWLASRGLRMVAHRKPPVRLARWIGVVEMPGAFNSHCVVMTRREILFDPTAFHWPGMPPVLAYGPEHVSSGISFSPLTTRNRRSA